MKDWFAVSAEESDMKNWFAVFAATMLGALALAFVVMVQPLPV